MKFQLAKSFLENLSLEPKINQVTFDDLDTYEKCSSFLLKTEAIPDEDLDDELIFKITHALHFLGLNRANSFRLKRLRLAGIDLNDLITYLDSYQLLKNLKHEFYSGEGRKSLGLILHGKPNVIYITKIIKYKDAYLKELNFYTSIRSLGQLSSITPRLILNSEFNGVFLLTMEYVSSQSRDEIIPIHMIMKSLDILSNITTTDYVQLTKNVHINRHRYNVYILKRNIYRNLISMLSYNQIDIKESNYILNKLKFSNLDEFTWTLSHGDNLSWNYKLFNKKVFIIDWETYSLDNYGRDSLSYILRNQERINLIEEYISVELRKLSSNKYKSLLVLVIVMFNEIVNHIKKSGISNEEQYKIIRRILEKFNEDNWKNTDQN